MKRAILSLVTVFFVVLNIYAAGFYVSVNGTARGNGTRANPWNLQTALNHPSSVVAGDTIWILGGTYRGEFTSVIRGREGAPIFVRAFPGQEVVLDGNVNTVESAVLNITGQHAWYWGLTITNSDATGNNYYKDGVYFAGPNNKLINCRIYNNGGNGVGFWRPALNSEVYGCVIYNNGFSGSTRGHGHGIYSQNETGTKIIRENILFHSHGNGIQIYTEGGSIMGYLIEGNTIFNSGIPGAGAIDRNIIIGGLQPADRISIVGNYLYNRANITSKASVQLGYSAVNRNAEFSGNYIVDGSLYMMSGWNSLQVTNNSFIARNSGMQLIAFDNYSNIATPLFNNNQYFVGNLATRTFTAWQTFSRQDANSTYSSSVPSQTRVILQPNRYEQGRGHIIVYNWGRETNRLVNLSSVVRNGSQFQIWDATNIAAGPLVRGVYAGGNVQIPLQLTQIELPIRSDSYRDILRHTLPEFGVFIVTSSANDGNVSIGDVINEEQPLKISACHPNPTVDLLVVEYKSPAAMVLNIDVIDSAGRMVMRDTHNATPGDNSYVTNLASLHGGVYLVVISDGKNQSATCKVLKRDFAINLVPEVMELTEESLPGMKP
ncbi:T9SS type A sorting domain-containing protein [Alkaliflexus imshenetskii]|uniref:T9SS type A sorting domain-containing protein n=1 Tax=Alkaliflexus imshenetskii TaxID=286730 RepID=UPI00047C53CA|nr:T9SS type A sorting domain-containing protein [Alkaliflexus imshenetskii]